MIRRAIASGSIALMACSIPTGQCTDIAEAGLTVHVVDATSGNDICDAVVTATDGAHTEELQLTQTSSSCSYAGAYERPGTYDVTVTEPNYATQEQAGIVVAAGVCHVVGKNVTFAMN